MSEATQPGEPAEDSPATQVSLPRWNELKREYNLRHATLVRFTPPISSADEPGLLPEPGASPR
jgi:hypothetical protein